MRWDIITRIYNIGILSGVLANGYQLHISDIWWYFKSCLLQIVDHGKDIKWRVKRRLLETYDHNSRDCTTRPINQKISFSLLILTTKQCILSSHVFNECSLCFFLSAMRVTKRGVCTRWKEVALFISWLLMNVCASKNERQYIFFSILGEKYLSELPS